MRLLQFSRKGQLAVSCYADGRVWILHRDSNPKVFTGHRRWSQPISTGPITIGAVYRTLGRRALSIYLTTVIVGSVVSGWLFGFLIDATTHTPGALHQAASWWSTSSAVALLLLIAWFAVGELRQKIGRRTRYDAHGSAGKHSCCE